MYEVSFRSFVYKLQSFKWRYFRLRSVLSDVPITHRHTRPWKRWPITIRIGCSSTVFSRLGSQRLLSVPKPLSGGSRERDSHRMRKSSRKPRRISKAWTFRTIERHRNVGKSLYQVYRPRRQLCWGINITLPKKRLFSLKIPGLFSPCKTFFSTAHVK